MQTKNGQESIRVQGADEKAQPALSVVDELTANRAMHFRRHFVEKIMNPQFRAIFAQAIGKHTVKVVRPAQFKDLGSECFDGTDDLDQNGLALVVLDANFNITT
jgi:hypothetical protein